MVKYRYKSMIKGLIMTNQNHTITTLHAQSALSGTYGYKKEQLRTYQKPEKINKNNIVIVKYKDKKGVEIVKEYTIKSYLSRLAFLFTTGNKSDKVKQFQSIYKQLEKKISETHTAKRPEYYLHKYL